MANLVFGLDLGQSADFSALAGLEQTTNPKGLNTYALKLLKRWPLGTRYPAIVSEVTTLLSTVPDAVVAVDQTGVGAPVVDLFKQTGSLNLRPIQITAGTGHSKQKDGWHVSKVELVGTAVALLQSGRLLFARNQDLARTLEKELNNFQVKVTISANETFAAREGQHDDLVLSVAMACWLGEHTCLGPFDVQPDPRARLVDPIPQDAFMPGGESVFLDEIGGIDL